MSTRQLIVSRTVKIRDGEIIIQEDTWPYYSYILKEGNAKVLKNVDGKQVLIGLFTEGDIFGEINFLVEMKRTASVIADGDVVVEMIARDTVMDFIGKLPRNVRKRLCTMARDITSITEIYSRLVVLLQNRNAETEINNMKIFETEKIPEFMRRIVITLERRHSVAVESLNMLSSQLEKKQTRLLSN